MEQKEQKTLPVIGKKTRYSEEELREFKQLIQEKLAQQKADLKEYKNQLKENTENQQDSRMKYEEVVEHTVSDDLDRLIRRSSELIYHLEKALLRIENKTYGICKDTGVLISKERLLAVPHATQSIAIKKQLRGEN
jgi:DnaK suppressor protein